MLMSYDFETIAEYYEYIRRTREQVLLTNPKARKLYVCDICFKTIEPGSKYWCRIFRMKGSRASPHRIDRRCLECGEPEPRIKVYKKESEASQRASHAAGPPAPTSA